MLEINSPACLGSFCVSYFLLGNQILQIRRERIDILRGGIPTAHQSRVFPSAHVSIEFPAALVHGLDDRFRDPGKNCVALDRL